MPMDDKVTAMRDLARRHGNAALGVLVEIMEDPDAKPNARVAAARSVLERGFGTPERYTHTDVNVNVFDTRQAHYEALKKMAEEPLPLRVEKGRVIDGEMVRIEPPRKSEFEE